MGNEEDEDIGIVLGAAAIFVGALWLLGKLIKNDPISRCPNCHLVVKNNISKCPRCGVLLQW